MWDWLLIGVILMVLVVLVAGFASEVARYFEQGRRKEPMPQTRWSLTQVPKLPQRLTVTVVVDTTAPAVVQAVEEAAARQGIRLERIQGCGHDGWVAGCPSCEAEERLATRLLEGAQ